MSKKLTVKVIICFSIFIFAMLLLNTVSVAATFSVSASKTTLNVQDTTKLTINGTGCLGKFTISSSDSNIVSVGESSIWIENTNSSVTLTAKKAGKATITVTATNVSDTAGENDITGSKSVNITVSEPKEEEAPSNTTTSKSSDATLKSITVGGKTYTNPGTDITVSSVSSDTTSIKIQASTNHSKATVSGTGTKELTTGTNKFTLKVTAESGATKSYVIRITRLAEENITPNIVDEKLPKKDVEENTEENVQEELKLTSLTIQGVELIPEFREEIFEYSAYIVDLEEINVNAVANLEGANVEITGNTGLIDGENIVLVKVTKDDKVLEYKITVNKTSLNSIQGITEEEESEEETKGIIGWFSDWWNNSGLISLGFTATLLLLGAAIIFAILSYKYSNSMKNVSRHSKVAFASENDEEE